MDKKKQPAKKEVVGSDVGISGSRTLEEALRESEERYRQIFEQDLAVKLLIEPGTGKILKANRAAASFYGYPVETLQQLLISDINQLDPAEIATEMQAALSEQRTYFVFPHRLASGEVRQVEVYSSPIDLSGQRVLYSIIHDITERKHSEEALTLSEDRYRTILKNMLDSYIEVDMAGNFTFINEATCRNFGYTAEELIGKNFSIITSSDDELKAVFKAYNEVYKTGEPHKGFAVKVLRKDGTTGYGEVSISLLRDSQGRTIGFRSVGHDISERKQAEDELRESEERFRRLSENSPDVIYRYRLKPVPSFEYVSPASIKISGYTPEDYYADPLLTAKIVHPEDRDRFKQYFRNMDSLGTTLTLRWIHKDGHMIWAEEVDVPVYDANGEIIALEGVARDITERKLAEEALKGSEAQYRLLAEHTADIVALMDMDLKVTYQSPSSEKLRGYTSQELIDLPLEKNLAPESLQLALEVFNRELPGIEADPGYNPVTILELEYYRKDGTTVWLESKFSIIRDVSGNPVSILLEARDITERKLTEEKLIKSYESVKKTLDDAINTMVKIVELRDPYTSGHQQKVADLATAIAGEMKLEDTRIDQLKTAAMIHDIGKMYIPSDILSKPGKLSYIILGLIKTHSQSGYDIVKSMDFPGVVAEAVLQHHERLDGSGYPNQLKGDDTLLEAKILVVADVIEAMASDRPYRPALGIDKALEEISKNRGKLYDPDVVDACLGLFKSGRFEFKTV